MKQKKNMMDLYFTRYVYFYKEGIAAVTGW